jgi:hypothetical protein
MKLVMEEKERKPRKKAEKKEVIGSLKVYLG